MKGIIYCKDSQSLAEGWKILEKIAKNYFIAKHELIQYRLGKNNITFAELSNGDIWRVIVANENCRGCRCNIAYVERSIDFDIFQTIIRPTVFDIPYSAIHLWGEGDLHISDKKGE